MMTPRHLYVRTVLNLYGQLPDTSPRSPLNDRAVADHFFDRQIPIDIVETALLLGSARRLFRCPALALPPIRSLADFESIVQQLLPHPFPPEFFHSWRTRYDGAMDDVSEQDPEPPF